MLGSSVTGIHPVVHPQLHAARARPVARRSSQRCPRWSIGPALLSVCLSRVSRCSATQVSVGASVVRRRTVRQGPSGTSWRLG